MKQTGFIVLSIGLVGLAIIIGIAKLTMHVDAMSGEFFTNWIHYLAPEMVFPVLIIILFGIRLLFIKTKE